MSAAHAASIVAVIGASGSGKSLWIKQQIGQRKPRRLLIWDPQAEYQHGEPFADRGALIRAVRAAGSRGKLAAIYRPGSVVSQYPERFDWFCKLALAWGNCVLIVDELGDVTKPGWAPDGWSAATRKGRHVGLKIIGAAQRPAIVDKTFFALATMIHCGRLNYRGDLAVMADVLSVPAADLIALKPLEWIERNMATGETRRGSVEV